MPNRRIKNRSNLGGSGLLGSSSQQISTRYNQIRTNQAVFGTTIPICFGQNRLSWKLLWYGNFKSSKAKQPGGSGLVKGGVSYVYSASVLGLLCHGTCGNILGVWDSTGKFAVDTVSENYTITGGSPTFTPANASIFAQDTGVYTSLNYAVPANDFGSVGAIVYAGVHNRPFVQVSSSPGPGQYSVNPGTGVYTFHPADSGTVVVINYTFFRYHIIDNENSTIPLTAPYQITVNNQPHFESDKGVSFYPSGAGLTAVSGTPTLTGTYNPNGGNYRFAAVDAGRAVTINYEYKDVNTDANAPNTLNLTFLNGALGQPPWAYLTSNFPGQALGYSQVCAVASSGLYLGFSPVLPQYNFEIAGLEQFGGGVVDSCPSDCIEAVLTDPAFGIGFPLQYLQTGLGSTIVSDNFGIGSALSSNWTTNEGTFAISSATLRITAVGGDSRASAWWSANDFSADQNVQGTVSSAPSSGSNALGVAARMSASGETYYALYENSTTWFLIKNISGTATTLLSGSRAALVGDILLLSIAGSTLIASINGVIVGSTTDTSIQSGQPGIAGIGTFSGSNSLDNWSATRAAASTGSGPLPATPTATTTDSTVNYGNTVAGSAAVPGGVNTTFFYARWTGYIKPTTTGLYTIGVNSGDGVNLFVNGVALVQNLTTIQTAKSSLGFTQSAQINLVAGVFYPVILEWQQQSGSYECQLAWIPPSASIVLIPSSVLSTTNSSVTGNLSGSWWNGNSTSWYPTQPIVPGLQANIRDYWCANGFFISPILDNQTPAASAIGDWLQAGQVYCFWSEGLLKFTPLGDTTAVGNGHVFSPPTNPIVSLDDDDFIIPKNGDPIKMTRSPWQNRWNDVRVGWTVRTNAYNRDILEASDTASIQQFSNNGGSGLMREDPKTWDFICIQSAAQFAANLRLQRLVNIASKYEITIKDKYWYLEPGDIVQITDGIAGGAIGPLGLNQVPVRLLKMVYEKDGIKCEAENFPYSIATAVLYPKQGQLPSAALEIAQQDPGNTSPLVFELPNRASKFQGNLLQIFANGQNSNWGGCNVWVSYNGIDYSIFGTIETPARSGVLASSLPSFTTAYASDTFGGAALSPNWTTNEGTFVESGNTCQISALGGDSRAAAHWNAATFAADQSVQATVATVPTGNSLGVAVRMAASGETYYALYESSTTWFLFKCITGTITVLASGATTAAAGDLLALSIIGTTLVAQINGTVVATQTDSSIASGQPGIAGFGTYPTSNSISNWSAGGPDTADTLSVNMAQSGAQLQSVTPVDAATFVTLCAIINSSNQPEFISYETATLTGANQYALTTLYRGVYNTTASSHSAGEQFVRLDPSAGLNFQYDSTYYGKKIFLKFTSFNIYGNQEQSLANVTANAFILQGLGPGSIDLNTGFLQPAANPNLFIGAYSGSVSYIIGNEVTFGGNYYKAIANTLGNAPTNTSFWQLVSVNSNVFLGPYSGSTAYIPGNQVTFNGSYYICIANTTGNAPTNASFWQLVSATSNLYLGNYSNAVAYIPGNQVSFQGSFWICISATTGNAPSTTSSFWTLLGTSSILIGAWSNSTVYLQGNEVTFIGNVFQALQGNTNQTPPTPPSTNAFWQLIGPQSIDSVSDGLIYIRGIQYESISIVIPNGNFEASTSLPVPGWTASSGATLSYDSSTPQSGNQSLKVSTSTTGSAAISVQKWAVNPGDTYLVAGYVKSDGTGIPDIALVFLDKTGALTGVVGAVGTTSTSWAFVSTSGSVPANTVSLQIYLKNDAATQPSAVEFDQIYAFRAVKLGGEVADGPQNFSATASTLTYRPTSNPLTAHDAGASATVNIASFTMRTSSKGDVSISSGSITALSYSQLYYVYYDDPTLAGGAVTFQVTTTKETAINGLGRFFVGSIVTPAATAPDTTGNNDGGVGAQGGGTQVFLFGTSTPNTGAGGTVINAGNAIDGNLTTFAKLNISSAASVQIPSLAVKGASPTSAPWSSLTLYIRSAVPTNTVSTGSASVATMQLNNNGAVTTVYTLGYSTTRGVTTDSVSLPLNTNLALLIITGQISKTDSASFGAVEMDIYEVWVVGLQ